MRYELNQVVRDTTSGEQGVTKDAQETSIAHVGGSQAQPKPRGSLSRMGVAFWLLEQDEVHRNARRLKTMSLRRKDGPDRDALWAGYWSLRTKADQMTETLRDCGGLLFVGQLAAIKAAQALEGGAA